jgi:tetratricopeptide (TPR) repeat protein
MAQKSSRSAVRSRTTAAQKSAAKAPARAAVMATPARGRSRDEELIENFFLGVLLFFLAVLIFFPVFHAGFIWDDDQLLTANPQVHSPDGWRTLWTAPQTADYFPLTSTTLWLEWQLWHMNAAGYHITNVLLHAITSVLTWQVLKRLRVPGAWLAAALFAVHPVCVESVAWISERKNTISQIFFLLSIIHYVRYEEKGKVWRYVAAVACFLLSLLAKTSVVMLPFILWILAWWRYQHLKPLRASYTLDENPVERGIILWSGVAAGMMAGVSLTFLTPIMDALGAMFGGALHPITQPFAALGTIFQSGIAGALCGGIGAALGFLLGARLRMVKQWENFAGFEFIRTIPFFLAAFLLGAVTIYFQYGRAIGGEEIPLGNLFQRIASACFATGFYLYSALWPFNIIEIYPQWHRAFYMKETFPTPHIEKPAPEALSYWIQIIPGLIIGGLLFYCWKKRKETWARTILVGLGCYIVAMVPALGLLKMSYMRLTLVADHFQYISIVAVIAMIVAAGQTRWLKPWGLVLASIFFAVVSYINWGQTQDNHFEEIVWIAGPLVLAVVPSLQETWKWAWGGFLAALLLCCSVVSWAQASIYESEESLWSATLAKNPFTWQGHNHLGAALYMRGDVKDAFPHFLRATQLKPENPESHNNLGLALMHFGMNDQAIEQYQLAVKIKDDSAMETNLANAYEEVKRVPEAIATYKHALKMNPDNASAWCNLGYALMQIGHLQEAVPCFMNTISIDPMMPQGRNDLAQSLRSLGIDPNSPPTTGTFSFDVQKAIDLVRRFPPMAPPPGQGPPQ